MIARTLIFQEEELPLAVVLLALAEQRSNDNFEGYVMQAAGEDLEALQAEITRLRGWLSYMDTYSSDGPSCIHEALSGAPLPELRHGSSL